MIKVSSNGSTARTCLKREVSKNDDKGEESEPCHSHHAGPSNGSRSLRLDPGDGHNGGDEHGEAEPYEPGHDGLPARDAGRSKSRTVFLICVFLRHPHASERSRFYEQVAESIVTDTTLNLGSGFPSVALPLIVV